MKVRLWYIRDTPAARLYCRVPSSRNPNDMDNVLLPVSQIESSTRYPVKEGEKWPEHIVTIPDWLAEKKGL